MSSHQQYTIFPINYPNLWKFYKNHVASFWTVEEVRLNEDLQDWERLNNDERHFIKHVLAFFASSDAIVNENLLLNFYREIDIPEVRQYYTIQMLMEACHNEQYSLLIETYIQDSAEKDHLFNAITTIPIIKRKAEWALKWIQNSPINLPSSVMSGLTKLSSRSDLNQSEREACDYILTKRPSLAQRLVAFICVEGIFFSGSFCAIYWLKTRGVLPGLCTANEFIARDENIHVEFAIELFKTLQLQNQITPAVVAEIVKDAVALEQDFVCDALPVSLIGMNKNLMKQYIGYIADRWLVLLGYPKIYNTENPFGFMDLISVGTRENFFELNVSQYKKNGVGNSAQSNCITFDEEF